jgi:predicted dehydrogenase
VEGSLRLAVVGLGRAGAARVRAIEALESVELAGLVTRGGGPGARSLDDVLGDPRVDGLCVCTPNSLHADLVRRALAADKHALVEYPLAPGPSEATELFALARERDRVLHVEHIELLSPSQEEQRRRVAELGRVQQGTLQLEAAAEGWIADRALAGSPALRAVARLHRLVDLFGEARVEGAALSERGVQGYRLEVELGFQEGGGLRLIEERRAGARRGVEWEIVCERGVLRNPPSQSPGKLFEEDLTCFAQRVRKGAPHYVSEDRIVHVLDLVRQIEESTSPS